MLLSTEIRVWMKKFSIVAWLIKARRASALLEYSALVAGAALVGGVAVEAARDAVLVRVDAAEQSLRSPSPSVQAADVISEDAAYLEARSKASDGEFFWSAAVASAPDQTPEPELPPACAPASPYGRLSLVGEDEARLVLAGSRILEEYTTYWFFIPTGVSVRPIAGSSDRTVIVRDDAGAPIGRGFSVGGVMGHKNVRSTYRVVNGVAYIANDDRSILLDLRNLHPGLDGVFEASGGETMAKEPIFGCP